MNDYGHVDDDTPSFAISLYKEYRRNGIGTQLMLGRYYLFIKNGAVIRLDSIIDIVRVTSHYKMVPTAVFLSVKVKDENGSMACPLCRVHLLKAAAEIDEIRRAVMQRHLSV